MGRTVFHIRMYVRVSLAGAKAPAFLAPAGKILNSLFKARRNFNNAAAKKGARLSALAFSAAVSATY